uniref:Uncharacterized protein n=1 Tax=Callorhinchus milii TaxID=7868 RepID=A0A4W3H054_CALMI
MPDAEVIYTVAEIIQEFPGLQARNYSVYLNHTVLLRAVLLHCGVPEDRLPPVCNILYETSVSQHPPPLSHPSLFALP